MGGSDELRPLPPSQSSDRLKLPAKADLKPASVFPHPENLPVGMTILEILEKGGISRDTFWKIVEKCGVPASLHTSINLMMMPGSPPISSIQKDGSTRVGTGDQPGLDEVLLQLHLRGPEAILAGENFSQPRDVVLDARAASQKLGVVETVNLFGTPSSTTLAHRHADEAIARMKEKMSQSGIFDLRERPPLSPEQQKEVDDLNP